MAPPSRRSRSEPPAPLAAAIAEHVGWLETAHYAASTVRARRRNLRHFAAWCTERGIGHPCELTLPVLERYRQTLFHSRKANGQPVGWGDQTQKLLAVHQPLANVSRPAPRLRIVMPHEPLRVQRMPAVGGQSDGARPSGPRKRATPIAASWRTPSRGSPPRRPSGAAASWSPSSAPRCSSGP